MFVEGRHPGCRVIKLFWQWRLQMGSGERAIREVHTTWMTAGPFSVGSTLPRKRLPKIFRLLLLASSYRGTAALP